jgi:hypothetical protein
MALATLVRVLYSYRQTKVFALLQLVTASAIIIMAHVVHAKMDYPSLLIPEDVYFLLQTAQHIMLIIHAIIAQVTTLYQSTSSLAIHQVAPPLTIYV